MTERHDTGLDCDRVDELAGAIALGALDPDELAAAAAHLDSCDQPHTELRELLGADEALALMLEPRDPGPELRARVLASAAASSRGRQRVPGTAAPAGAGRRWIDWTSVRFWRGVAIAAVVVLLVGAVSWVGLRQQIATRDAALSAVADAISSGAPAFPVSGPAGTGYVIDTEGPGATFLVAGLESLPAGDLYEMWLIDAAGTPLAVGTIDQSNPDLVVATVEQDLAGFALFAVTVEQEPVDAPTSDPVMVATLTN
jgi:anti-sigma-K factor RskA